MKKLFYFLAVLLCTVACQKYDDTQIKQDIKDLQQQVASIQAWCSTSQAAVDAVASLQEAVEKFNGIASVEPFSDDLGSGYRICLDNGKEIIIYNVRMAGEDSYLGVVNVSESSVEFVFSDGKSLIIPRLDTTIRFETYEKQIVSAMDTINLVLSPSFAKADFAGIKAEIASNYGTDISVVTKGVPYAQAGWKIKVIEPEFGEDGKVTKAPAVSIEEIPGDGSDAILTVTLVDNAGVSHTTATTLASNYEENEPTEDLMEVTTTRKAVLYGNETEGFGASLIRRFKNIGGAYDENTKVCIVANSAIVSGALTQKDYRDIYDCYKKGGVVIVISPTHQGFNGIFQPKMAEAVNSQYVRAFNMKVNGQAPASNGTDTFLSQIQIPENGGQAWDGLGFSIKGILYCEDLDGNEQKGEDAATPYQIGLRADAAVKWMERSLVAYSSQIDDEIEKAKTTVTYLHSMFKHYPDTFAPRVDYLFCLTSEAKNAFIEDITYVVAHDTQAHTDYYLISQNAEFRNNMISPVPKPENNTWWWRKDVALVSHDDIYPLLYVHSFYNWKSTLSVSMSNGKSVRIKNSSPEADNSTTTTTTTVTDGTMESHTAGLSVGGSLGGSPAGISGMISSSISHSWTTGTSHSVAVGVARSKKDITILKQANDNKVTWTYSGKPLSWYTTGGGYYAWDMGDLQFTSMTQTNSLLAEVKNVTDGAATLTIDNEVTVRSGFYIDGFMVPTEQNLYISDCPTRYSTTTIQLPTPYRYTQTWMFNCVSYGDMQSSTDKSNLWNDVEKNLLRGASKYEMGEFTANGTMSAQAVVDLLLQEFKSRADHYKATYNASGTFKFEFRRADTPGQVITAEYTIK